MMGPGLTTDYTATGKCMLVRFDSSETSEVLMYAENGTDTGLLGGGSRTSFSERCAAKQLADVPGKYMHFYRL